MLTVITLLKLKLSPNGEQHGERAFWREHGLRYLETWIKSVNQFISGAISIEVMTDSPEVLRSARFDWPEYHVLDKTVDAPGFWAKLEMFKHGEGKTLYMDLDNVINGPLDELVALKPDPLIMLDDRRVPGLPNGSMILFDADRCRHLWIDYATDPRAFEGQYIAYGDDYSWAYDQAYIAKWADPHHKVSLFQELLPDGYILNARSELPTAPDWKTARVIFGGGAEGKPHLSTHPGFALR